MPSSQILPLLFVGDEIAPEVHAFGYVLNITEEVPRSALFEPDVLFRRFPILDVNGDHQEQQRMLSFFPATCVTIQGVRDLNRAVLVHCTEGKQRSCMVVAAFLM
jgi:hypothetical protein